MKLITKASYYYLILTGVLFAAGSTVFYFYISRLLNEEINEQLDVDKAKVLEYVHETGQLPPYSPIRENIIQLIAETQPSKDRIGDTMLLSPLLDEHLPYRYYSFTVEIQGQFFKALIIRPLIEKDDLLEIMAKSLGVFALLFIVLLFLMNRWLSNHLWKPFYTTLFRLKESDPGHPRYFPNEPILEFNELHQELNRMTRRIADQFQHLKEFNENASHEMQTPLAIVRNKLEVLMQSSNLREQEMDSIREAYESTHRISRMIESLLLLSKIENRQFAESKPVRMGELIQSRLEFCQDLVGFKKINLETRFDTSPPVEIDPYLADILVTNVIGNAIRHSPEGSNIQVAWINSVFTVSNTGPPLTLPEDQLFNRFSKGNVSGESSGLGLAIARQICDLYGFRISYHYISPVHHFIIRM